MKHNTLEVAQLEPDYLGFIFFEKSKRNYDKAHIEILPEGIKKVGVFVDASIAFVVDKIKQFQFDVIQLHGSETPKYCKTLQTDSKVEVWKVFSIKDHFDFSVLEAYETVVDKFLFDTKGKEKGGNGYTFDWSVLQDYPSQKPFILSGGIGLEEIPAVNELKKTKLPLFGIDVNSKFEDKPGLKNIDLLKSLVNELNR
ncbi:MAG: phosphoribosylanthranilate isomerase [Leeuwenhoekiella sp.]|uniref:phosphoribosylanthranilate isomerase n=1 Tax=Leeuwenhoekiella TaxID=283735 RepID=UPI002352857A|nr:phosphoribosylanthranilate isomerase [Leeuwenhoekiella blandensis]|tara:strand:+ start:2149 stop:2742 length:594 start_codon:yes stop_codon:yes gene_type:complete